MTNARKGRALPTGHGETRGDAHKLHGPFEVDGSVKPRMPVKLSSDEKTLAQATAPTDDWPGVLPYFDGSEVDWGTTTPSEETAYPTTAKIPWIYDRGHVKTWIDASEASNDRQMGHPLVPKAGGFGEADGSLSTATRVAHAADLLVGNDSDGFGEVRL